MAMTFEVPVSTVSRSRGQRSVLAVAGLSGLIVLGGLVAGWLAPRTPSPAAALPAQAAVVANGRTPSPQSVRLAPIPRIATASVARPMPALIDCHGMEIDRCERLIRAALRVLPADFPDVRDAGVWRSLVCNNDFDCPPAYLRESPAAGSVIVRFVDGSPGAAINVVDWRYGSAIRLGLRAWIARSIPIAD
jgi:hypothetical protein